MGGVIIVFICIIGAIIWGIYAGKKRRDAMTLLAEELGLSFHHDRNYQIADRFSFLDKLDQGSNRYAYNILSGQYKGHQVAAFDYHYETHSRDKDGKRQTHHHHFSFFTLTLPKYFPELTIAREGFFSKIAQAVGYDDIDFESHEFSKRFVVRSRDKKFAYDFCNAQMIDHLLNYRDIDLEVDQNMMAAAMNSCLKVEEIKPHLDELITIRNLIPDYVVQS